MRHTNKAVGVETLLIGIALFAVYAAGAAPTMYVGDSGELVAAVATLGIPHPSGYPLYVLLGKLWTLLIPLGSIAYRMSLFSAAAAASACALLYATARRALGLDRIAALLACGLMAFAPSFWAEANIQRVYALNAIFVVLVIACACRWQHTRSVRALVATLFLCGLGSTNHTVMAVIAIAFVLFALATEVRVRRLGLIAWDFAWGAVAFFVGLLPYVYLPLRSRADPALDWGNPETLRGVVDVILRRGFWERAWIESPLDLLPITGDYLLATMRETAWVGAALLLVGIVAGRRRNMPVAFLLLLMLGNLAVVAVHGSRSDIFIWHRYYISSFIAAALLAGIGWQTVSERVPAAVRPFVLTLPVFLFASGRQQFDRSRYRVAEDFAGAVLESLPPGAHLVASDDNVLFVLIYLHLAEGRRPDVDLILEGVGKAELPPLHFDPDRDPLFFTHHPNWNLPALEIVPVGVVYRAWRRGQPPPEVVIPRTELAGEHDPNVPKDYLTQNLIGHFHYTLGFTFEQHDWLRARSELEKAAHASPDNDVLFYNLGLVYARNGLYDDALAAFRRSEAINPRALASESKAQASAKITELTATEGRIRSIEARLLAEHRDVTRAETPEFHERLAGLLGEAHEDVAARGHRLRAEELRAARMPPGAQP